MDKLRTYHMPIYTSIHLWTDLWPLYTLKTPQRINYGHVSSITWYYAYNFRKINFKHYGWGQWKYRILYLVNKFMAQVSLDKSQQTFSYIVSPQKSNVFPNTFLKWNMYKHYIMRSRHLAYNKLQGWYLNAYFRNRAYMRSKYWSLTAALQREFDRQNPLISSIDFPFRCSIISRSF